MTSVRSIVRGAIGRVLPGFAVGWALFVAFSPYARSIVTPGRIATALLAGAAAALGSTIALSVMRRRLRSDAGVDGRRAFLVGIGALAVTLAARPFLPHLGTVGEYALMASSGAVLAAGVDFPWLVREPAAQSAGEREAAAEY